MGFKAKPLCLKWNGPTTGKGIKNGWRIAAAGLLNLLTHFIKQVRVLRVLPYNKALDESVKPFALYPLSIFVGEQLWVRTWVIDELTE